jgi:hypothetical protein
MANLHNVIELYLAGYYSDVRLKAALLLLEEPNHALGIW